MKAVAYGVIGTLVLALGAGLVVGTWVTFMLVCATLVVLTGVLVVGPLLRARRALALLYDLTDRAVWRGEKELTVEEVAGIVETTLPPAVAEERLKRWAQARAWSAAEQDNEL